MDYEGLIKDFIAMDLHALEAAYAYHEDAQKFVNFSIACSQFRAEIMYERSP